MKHYQQCWRVMVALCASALVVSGCSCRQKPAVEVVSFPESSPYRAPLISPGTKFAALPPAVQHTVRAQTGGAELEDVVKDVSTGPPVYRIYFRERAIFPPLYVAPDGSVLNPDLTVAMGASRESVEVLTGGASAGLTLGDLPPQVVRTIQQRVPNVEVDKIGRELRGDQVVYIVFFKAQDQAPLAIAADGTVVSLSAPALPSAPGRAPSYPSPSSQAPPR
jgi:hypothetical protein